VQRIAFQIRLYPSKDQEILLAQTFGCARWWWNYALNKSIEVYKETGKGIGQVALLYYQNAKKLRKRHG